MVKGLAVLSLIFILAGCAGVPMMPCSDADPVGICASSHGNTYEGR
jgi:hypothetical protein